VGSSFNLSFHPHERGGSSFVLVEFYKEKQRRKGGDEKMYVEVIKITTAEELSICASATHSYFTFKLMLVSF
jgi:hypothetical protein